MPVEIKFELKDSDVEHFRSLFKAARAKAGAVDVDRLLEDARSLVAKNLASDPPDFVRERLERLNDLVTMVGDSAWDLPAEDRDRVIEALAYFVLADDLIPDSTPVIGLLDDAIAAELVLRSLEHELAAYREFSEFRAAERDRRAKAGKPTDISKEDWLADRRAVLHTRMRDRRLGDPGGWHSITLFGV